MATSKEPPIPTCSTTDTAEAVAAAAAEEEEKPSLKQQAKDAKEFAQEQYEVGSAAADAAKSIASGDTTAGAMAATTAMDAATGAVTDRLKTGAEKKIFGVGAEGLNNAKVFFIILTGVLALVEASTIMATCTSTVLLDTQVLKDSAIMPILSGLGVGDKEGVEELSEKFNSTDFYPSCLDGPGLNRSGYVFGPAAPPPVWTISPPPPFPPGTTRPPSTPPWWTISPPPSPPSPPPFEDDEDTAAVIGGATTEQALTNLWMMDTSHTDCSDDKLFQGTATVDDCHPADTYCIDYINKYANDVAADMRNLRYFYTLSLFIAAVCYTGARLSLHNLTKADSTMCSCCPGCMKKFLLFFLKKGGPVSLNALMVLNTKLKWDDDLKGYSIGVGQWDMIFFSGNLFLMIIALVVFLITFIVPLCCAGCCKMCGCSGGVKGVKKGARGYLIIFLYLLSTWGFLTTVISAFVHFVQKNYGVDGLAIPKSPSATFESFPLVDIAMTMLMVPPGLSVALSSDVPIAQFVAGVRCIKVGAVAMPFIIDILLLVLDCKTKGPPMSCCRKCAPSWCGPHPDIETGGSGQAPGTVLAPNMANKDKKKDKKKGKTGKSAAKVVIEGAENELNAATAAVVETGEGHVQDVQAALETDGRAVVGAAKEWAGEQADENEQAAEDLEKAKEALEKVMKKEPVDKKKLEEAIEAAYEARVADTPAYAPIVAEAESLLAKLTSSEPGTDGAKKGEKKRRKKKSSAAAPADDGAKQVQLSTEAV